MEGINMMEYLFGKFTPRIGVELVLGGSKWDV
jgi:hypothetical protein